MAESLNNLIWYWNWLNDREAIKFMKRHESPASLSPFFHLYNGWWFWCHHLYKVGKYDDGVIQVHAFKSKHFLIKLSYNCSPLISTSTNIFLFKSWGLLGLYKGRVESKAIAWHLEWAGRNQWAFRIFRNVHPCI